MHEHVLCLLRNGETHNNLPSSPELNLNFTFADIFFQKNVDILQLADRKICSFLHNEAPFPGKKMASLRNFWAVDHKHAGRTRTNFSPFVRTILQGQGQGKGERMLHDRLCSFHQNARMLHDRLRPFHQNAGSVFCAISPSSVASGDVHGTSSCKSLLQSGKGSYLTFIYPPPFICRSSTLRNRLVRLKWAIQKICPRLRLGLI